MAAVNHRAPRSRRWLGRPDVPDRSQPGTTPPDGTTDDPTAHDGAAPTAPVARPATSAPLPARDRQQPRPRIQGLAPGTGELRRRQVTGPDPVPGDRLHAEALAPLADTLGAHLRAVEERVAGFGHALLSTVAGTVVAQHLVAGQEATALAAASSALLATGGGEDEVDHVVVRLKDGSTVVVATCGTARTPLLLRLHAAGAGMGLLLHVVQEVAERCAETIGSAEDA